MGIERVIVAVADAGPIIHLDEIDALGHLSVVDDLLVPRTVYDELQAGTVPPALADIEYDLCAVDEENQETSTNLDPGETAALIIASEQNAVLLTDDLEAREAAQNADIEVHGSIGVIVLAFARDNLPKSEAIERMRSLQTETSLFVTDAVVEQGIALLEEES